MAVAKIYPEPKRGEHSELKNSTGAMGFDKAYLSQSRQVLAYSDVLADAVLSGDMPLQEA